MSVRKAVIPAAGLGTRFIPATKSQPKEMIPVVDKPGIQYVVEEAVRAGLDDILIVTGRNKGSIEDHFDRSLELEQHLRDAGKDDQMDEIRAIADMAQVHYVRQKEPLGFGHAVLVARQHVAGEPFAVMVGDEIVPEPRGDEIDLMPQMIDASDKYNASVVAVQEVPREDVSAYGAIDAEPVDEHIALVKTMVEKPSPEEAPSNLASRGRYVFSPDIFDMLERTQAGVGNEIQLTDAINALAQDKDVYSYTYDGVMFDVGKKLEYLKAVVELALRRDDLKAFGDYLSDVAARR